MIELDTLLARMEAEARSAPFPIDQEVYEKVGKDPLVPIACAGNPAARICSFGRDLGKDEVRHGQPQVGAAGKLVRRGVLEAAGLTPDPKDRLLESALEYIFLSNTVPYKPPGNKAYAVSVKERFRPFVAALLVHYWQGDVVITLGTEAFQWFTPYAKPGAAAEFWAREDRYESEFICHITSSLNDTERTRRLTICPLPHPSPLNQRWLPLFPALLANRLDKWLGKP
jgi:uracil-DNA glycosylase family 4